MSDTISSTGPLITNDSCDWYDVPCVASSFMDWLLHILIAIPDFLLHVLLTALLFVFKALPALCCVDVTTVNLGSLGGIVAGFGYLAHIFALKDGFQLIGCALLLRFVLRRIPFIG